MEKRKCQQSSWNDYASSLIVERVLGLLRPAKVHWRIHVERVIRLLRQKYTFLGETVPIDYPFVNDGKGIATIDKIATKIIDNEYGFIHNCS